jgi:hypothetical protein
MKLERAVLPVFAALGLVAWCLPFPVLGQTIYASYAITNLGGSPGGTFFFNHPYDVAVYHSTNIYVAATYDYTIRKLSLQGGTNWVMTTLAGSSGNCGASNGVGTAARFCYPQGVAVDSVGNVFVADSGNTIIRKITPDGTVTTFAGMSGQSGNADGTGSDARFAYQFLLLAGPMPTIASLRNDWRATIAPRARSGVAETQGWPAHPLAHARIARRESVERRPRRAGAAVLAAPGVLKNYPDAKKLVTEDCIGPTEAV